MLDDGGEISRSGVTRHKFLIKTFTNVVLKTGKNSYQNSSVWSTQKGKQIYEVLGTFVLASLAAALPRPSCRLLDDLRVPLSSYHSP